MNQPDLFTGEQLRDYGIEAAERDRTIVIQAVDRAITILADTSADGFTAEDVRSLLGRYVRDLDDVSKVIGGRIRAAGLDDRIYTYGETRKASRASAHARRMLVWYGKGEA